MSWFQQGAEGAEAAKQDEDDRAKRSGIYRLWLPVGGSTQFTLLDTAGFYWKEHNYKAGGSWQNWETCIQDIGEEDCPFCEAGIRYYYQCAFTVVDHAVFHSRRLNKQVTNMKKLLVLRSTARKKMLRKKDQNGGDITYCRFEAHRDDSKECNTGEDFDFIQRYTKEEVMAMAPAEYMGRAITPEEWIKPYDYMELFKPKSAAALARIIGRTPSIGSQESPRLNQTASTTDNQADQNNSDASGETPPSVSQLL